MESRASPFDLHEALLSFERKYIQNILTLAEGDIERAAQMLGIHSHALRRKLRDVQRDEYTPQPPGARRRALNHNIEGGKR